MLYSRREFLRLAGMAAGAGLMPDIQAVARTFGTAHCIPTRESPNVIMIVMDTLRADHLSLTGYTRNTSPYLDDFAKRAVVFRNAISPAPWTFPSFVSLMTGMFAFNHNQNLAPAAAPPLNCPFIPELMGQAGYNTIMVLVNCFVEGFAYGFNENYHFCDYGNKEDNLAIDTVVDRIASAAGTGERFFMLVWLMGPHRPYEPANGFLHEFVNDDLYMSSPELNVDILGHLITPQELPADVLSTLGQPLMPDGRYHDYRLYVAAYDSEIKHADYQIGRLFTALHENAMYDDTMIVFTSDHGENMVDHEICFWHGDNLYNSLVHVPLMIKFPRQKGSIAVKKQVRTIDALPTVCQVIGVDPGETDGKSLVPFVTRKRAGLYQRPCISFWKPSPTENVASIVRGRYKLIKSSAGEIELYDYLNDHDETTNLIASHRDVYEALNQYLEQFVQVEKL